MIKWLLTIAVTFFVSGVAYSSGGNFGLGLVIGAPTGISGSLKKSGTNSYTGALAFDLRDDEEIHFHLNYLTHSRRSLALESALFGWYWGIGARLRSFDYDNRFRDDDELRLGPRLSVGVDYEFRQNPLEIFLDLALSMDIIPSTDADLDLGLGLRYYF